MSEPRKPIFAFLWPTPDPDAPVDGAYRQVRKVRIPGRGALRVALLLVVTVLVVSVIGAALLAGLAVPSLPGVLIGAVVSASALFLALRGWVVGTFVTDDAIAIETTWRRTTLTWAQVADLEVIGMRTPLLGLPIPVTGRRCVVRTRDGRTIPTHLYPGSPDLLFSDEAFDIACTRLQNWRERR